MKDQNQKQPNVIFIIADQMRWDALPFNGSDFVKAPHFSRMASQGVNFSCCCSGNPVCVPARGILATGAYSHKCMDPAAQNQNGGRILEETYPHIVNLFNDQGYKTYGVGKFHYCPYKKNPGFDRFEIAEEGRIENARLEGKIDKAIREDYEVYLESQGYGGMSRAHGIGNNDIRAGKSPLLLEHYVDTWATTRSLSMLQDHLSKEKDKPFFLQLGWVKPHAPYDPPAPYDTLYDPLKIPKPWGSENDLKSTNPLAAVERENYLIDRMSEGGIQYSRAHYFGLISYLDSQMGRILDFLDSRHLTDNTLIVFTADHGDNLGDHGLFFKRYFYEGGVRVPLLFYQPGRVPAGVTYDKPVGQEDVMPTICDLAKIKRTAPIDGQSLVPKMNNPALPQDKLVISQYDMAEGMTIMARQGRYKYCFARIESTEELYDLENDPKDLKNLAKEPHGKDALSRMRTLTNQWCIDQGHDPILDSQGGLVFTPFEKQKFWKDSGDKIGIDKY